MKQKHYVSQRLASGKLIIKTVSKRKQRKEMENGNERKEKLEERSRVFVLSTINYKRNLLRSFSVKTLADCSAKSRRRAIFCTEYETNCIDKQRRE